ncbi:hypothetical protein D3C75_754400 [compost metagenome]
MIAVSNILVGIEFGHIIGVDGFHLLLGHNTCGLVGQIVQHLRERLGGGQLNDLVFAVLVAGFLLVGDESGNFRRKPLLQTGLHRVAAAGNLHGVQSGRISHQLHLGNMLMQRIGAVVGHGILVLGTQQGEDNVISAYTLAGIHSQLILDGGEVDIVAEDEVVFGVAFSDGEVIGQGAFSRQLVVVGQVQQTDILVSVDNIDGAVITLDRVQGGQSRRSGLQDDGVLGPLGGILEVQPFPRQGTGFGQAHAILVQDLLVEGLGLHGVVQGSNVGLIEY